MTAARLPARSDPAKSQFFLSMATAQIVCSTGGRLDAVNPLSRYLKLNLIVNRPDCPLTGVNV